MTDPVLILGGTSLITRYLTPRLAAEGQPAIVVVRTAMATPEGATLVGFDELRSGRWRVPEGCAVASLLPLAVLVPLLPALGGARRVVALGSTSVFSKQRSADPGERAGAETLRDAETALAHWSAGNGPPNVLLRPTLVYDGRGDKNIARMARFIRRWRCLPLAAPAAGLRQPIHADDVAAAMVSALGREGVGGAFNIAGGERLTYRAMAERVFRSLGLPPRPLMLPPGLIWVGFSVAGRLGMLRGAGFSGSVFDRMNEDLVYDVAPGLEALALRPRVFDPLPGPVR